MFTMSFDTYLSTEKKMVVIGRAFLSASAVINTLGCFGLMSRLTQLTAANASALVPRICEGILVGMIAAAEIGVLVDPPAPKVRRFLFRLIAAGDFALLAVLGYAYWIGWEPPAEDKTVNSFAFLWAPIEIIGLLLM
jgi:hypothetical protein